MIKPILDQMAEALKECISSLREIIEYTEAGHEFTGSEIECAYLPKVVAAEQALTAYKEQKADWVMVKKDRYYQGRELIKELRRKLKYYARRPKDSKEHYPAIQEIFEEVEAYLTEPDEEEK